MQINTCFFVYNIMMRFLPKLLEVKFHLKKHQPFGTMQSADNKNGNKIRHSTNTTECDTDFCVHRNKLKIRPKQKSFMQDVSQYLLCRRCRLLPARFIFAEILGPLNHIDCSCSTFFYYLVIAGVDFSMEKNRLSPSPRNIVLFSVFLITWK